ncbi:MAG: BadF/BadG/BcrA/BcrD ATPase family protein, partial [Micromonosporaceae bacterium]
VHHTADGYGWLLGDDGSGYWLGREAVRATLRALDLRQPPGALARGVLDSLLGTVSAGAYRSLVDGDRTTCIRLHGALVNRIYQRPPTWLAELAPLVTAAYRQGDQAAKAITARAVQLLADTVAGVRTPEEDTPIVLAGGVLAESPVGPALRTLLGTRYAGPITTARDGSAGSAWLALTRLDRHDATDASHRRLMETSVP